MNWQLVVGVVLAVLVLRMFMKSGGDLNTEQAKEMVKQGALLVDVRSPEEFSGGHVPGAKNIPVQELSQRLSEFGAKDGPILLYCASGMRSAGAAQMLKSAGYSKVYNLGGMPRW